MAAWPALFSENDGRQRARPLMDAAIAIAFALALLQLLAQLLRPLVIVSHALLASQLLPFVVLVVLQQLFWELVGTEAALTLPARVSLKVFWMKPLCTAVFAYQLALFRTRMVFTFKFRPVLGLKCGLAFAASKLRLTVSAYQAFFFVSWRSAVCACRN